MDGQMAAPQPMPQPSPQPTPQQPANDPMAKLRDLLAIKLAEIGSQQETPVPRYQGGQIPPGSGLAAARNPAIMKDVLDRADTPAQAAFQQAMQQHNEASANQKEFLQYGTGMINSQARGMAANKGQIRLIQTEDENGNPITVPMEWDPLTRTLKPANMIQPPTDQPQTAFPRYVAPTVQPGIEGGNAGYFSIDKTGRQSAKRVGGNVQPMPTGELATQTGSAVTSADAMRNVWQAFNGVNETQRQRSLPERFLRDKVAQNSYGAGVTPDLTDYYTKVKSALFPYVKSITGAQFSINELNKYESQFPKPGFDTPETARTKMVALVNNIVNDINAKYRTTGRVPPDLESAVGSLFGGIGAQSQQQSDGTDDIQSLIDAERAKSNGR